ncbi:hypothetical protein EVA_10903 [gut metagenome]|uniref:Uncharacterized protein n=1 Tax=gut metagenome TaxID=749906 RepID=J9G2B3_9ZZZZ
MPFNFCPTDGREGVAYACEQQAQVFVNFRTGAHR